MRLIALALLGLALTQTTALAAPNLLLRSQAESRFDLKSPGYFIFGFDSNDPPQPQLENNQVRFKIPLRYRLVDLERIFGWIPDDHDVHVYVDYTQDSFWNLWDDSAPFYDTSFMPGAYAYYARPGLPVGFAAGVLHHSNGRAGPLSRSWNRFYGSITAGDPKANAFFGTLTWWGTWGVDDNNADITDYLGNGEIDLWFVPGALPLNETLFGADRLSFQVRSALDGIKFFQNVEVSVMVRLWKQPDLFSASLYAQYWSGSGLILRDYQDAFTQWRVGLAMVPNAAFNMQ